MNRQTFIESIDEEYQPCRKGQKLYHLPLLVDAEGSIMFVQCHGIYSNLPLPDNIPAWASQAQESGFGRVDREFIGSRTHGRWRKVFCVFKDIENTEFKQFLKRNWWAN